MAVKITYFVHGTTLDNIEHKATGWNPGALSEKGIEQSIVLKDQVDINKFDIVISSDLERAIDSARYTFGGVKEIIYDERIRECNYGDFNGKDSKLVTYDEHIEDKFPNGESMKDVEARVRDFCRYLLENYDGKEVALVAHRAPQLAFEVITKKISWEEAISNDWRKSKAWQPGWEYIIEEENVN